MQWLERLIYIPLGIIFWMILIVTSSALFDRIPKQSRLGRLISAERRWCWKRGGNWWRGGLPPEQ